MAIQTVLATLDGVDDALKPLYTQDGDRFVLQLQGVNDHPDVRNLSAAYERVKQDRDAIRQERDTFKTRADAVPDDFSAEAWAKAKEGKADQAQLVQLRQTLERERDEWKAKAETAEATALRNALDRDLTDALNASGVTNPTFAKAARLMLSEGVKMQDGRPVVETDMGPLPLADHVKRWAASEGKAFVTPPSGGGARGGETGGDKPLSEMTGKERLQLAMAGKLNTG